MLLHISNKLKMGNLFQAFFIFLNNTLLVIYVYKDFEKIGFIINATSD